MEKAILKTLAYADLFDYPLKINEVQRWLVGRKASLRQVAKALSKLHKVSSIKYKGRYYFLPKRNEIVSQRRWRRKQSEIYFRKAKILSQILKAVLFYKSLLISLFKMDLPDCKSFPVFPEQLAEQFMVMPELMAKQLATT